MREKFLRIVGAGNTIKGDDGLGIWAVRELSKTAFTDLPRVDFCEATDFGLNFIDYFEGYRHGILIDAWTGPDGSEGELIDFILDRPGASAGLSSISHHVNPFEALELGRKLGVALPEHIRVLGVTIKKQDVFSESLGPKVRQGMVRLIENLKSELKIFQNKKENKYGNSGH